MLDVLDPVLELGGWSVGGSSWRCGVKVSLIWSIKQGKQMLCAYNPLYSLKSGLVLCREINKLYMQAFRKYSDKGSDLIVLHKIAPFRRL